MKQKFFTLFATLLCCISMFADGALSGKFTINAWGNQVVFSQGNLQYRQSDDTYRFAPTQYTIQGDQNQTALETIDAGNNTSIYIDLFGWGTGMAPYFHSTSDDSYSKFYEWGNEAITNGGNAATPWRTLTDSEWFYLFYNRTNAEKRFAFGKVNGVNGLIILPDEWETPSGLTFKPSTTRGLENSSNGTYINTYENNFDHNTYNGNDWDRMEQAGAVFLPAAGWRDGTSVSSAGQEGYYWSSEPNASKSARCISFDKGKFYYYYTSDYRSKGMSVHLVQEEPKLEVYTEFMEETGTLTYYYDMNRLERTGLTEHYDPVNNPNAPRFKSYHTKVKKAVIAPSMKDAPLTSMEKMFYGVTYNDSLLNMTSIEGLDNLNTSKVTTMRRMFEGCTALTSLDLSSFNTENVTDMRYMFFECKALTSLDLSSFNTENVTDMGYMFYECTSLKTIYCDYDWSTTTAESDDMFYGCEALVGGKGTKYYGYGKTYARPDGGTESPGYFTAKNPTPKVYTEFVESTGTLTYYYDLQRSERTGKTELYDPVGSPNAVRFAGYSEKVTKAVIDPSMKDAPLTSMRMMFYGRSDPETLKTYNLSNLTTIEGLENLNTSIVTDVNNMFFMCSSLTSLDLSSFNTSNVTDMRNMFLGCNALQAVDLTSFDVSKVTTMQGMFGSCRELTTICCNTDWRTSPNLTNSYLMFAGCNKIVGDKGTTFINDNNRDATYAHPDGGTSDPGYFSIYHKGDADGNGVVNAADIVAISNYMMGNPPAGFSKASADVNLDGVINIADIVALANILLND